MAKHELRDRTIFDTLNKRVDALGRRVQLLESAVSIALPVYDKTDLPPMVDNTVFMGTDNTLNIYKDGEVFTFTPS